MTSENVKINAMQKETSDLIAKCDFLITDFSGIMFDFLYQGKQIVRYEFDVENLIKDTGGRILPSNELLGEVVLNIGSFIKKLEEHLKGGNDPLLKEKQKTFFEYIDNKNCERTLKLIEPYIN